MFFNTSEKTKNEYVNEILSNDSFTDLKLDLIDLDLKIKAGDHFEVHYRGPIDKKPSLVFNENLLEIKEPKVERKPGKFWKKGIIEINIVTDKDRGELVITVPEDQQLHMLNASSVSGDSSLENLKLEALMGFAVSGDLDLKKVEVEDAKLTTTTGDIECTNVVVNQGKVKLISGDFKMKNSEVGDEVKVSTTSGDTLVENTKVAQYQLSTLSGDNSLFGKSGAAAQIGDENNKSRLILSTLSGDNTVR